MNVVTHLSSAVSSMRPVSGRHIQVGIFHRMAQVLLLLVLVLLVVIQCHYKCNLITSVLTIPYGFDFLSHNNLQDKCVSTSNGRSTDSMSSPPPLSLSLSSSSIPSSRSMLAPIKPRFQAPTCSASKRNYTKSARSIHLLTGTPISLSALSDTHHNNSTTSAIELQQSPQHDKNVSLSLLFTNKQHKSVALFLESVGPQLLLHIGLAVLFHSLGMLPIVWRTITTTTKWVGLSMSSAHYHYHAHAVRHYRFWAFPLVRHYVQRLYHVAIRKLPIRKLPPVLLSKRGIASTASQTTTTTTIQWAGGAKGRWVGTSSSTSTITTTASAATATRRGASLLTTRHFRRLYDNIVKAIKHLYRKRSRYSVASELTNLVPPAPSPSFNNNNNNNNSETD